MGRARQSSAATSFTARRGAVASDTASHFDAVFGIKRGIKRVPGFRTTALGPCYVGPHPYIVDDTGAWTPVSTMVGFPGQQVPSINARCFAPAVGAILELDTNEELYAGWDDEDLELLHRLLQDLPTPVCVRVLDRENGSEEILRLPTGEHTRVVSTDEAITCVLESVHGDQRVFGFGVECLGLLPAGDGELYRSRVRDIPTPLNVGTPLYRAPKRAVTRLLTASLETALRSFVGERADLELLAAIDTAHRAGRRVRFTVEGPFAVGNTRDRHRVLAAGHEQLGVEAEALIETVFKADDSDDEFCMYMYASDVLRPLRWERELGGCPALF